ncbi:unnamed protein product [Urochloa decumbens]|uniref:Myb/SANT-like domain-containing protein n=1 Tax=Urochloa decumbens TaxID=240449 RepID=A0ABC8WYN4_9POAL
MPPQGPGVDFVNLSGEDAEENTADEYSGSGSHAVSTLRANWSDENNAILLRLCIEQLRAGHYIDGTMTGQGYKNIAERFYVETGLMYKRSQFRHQIGQLRSTYSFWRFLQKHTGLGRKPNGSIDADSDFWKRSTKNKPWLNKLKNGLPPPNLEELEEMFSGTTVDGSTGYVAGQDFYEDADMEQDEDGEDLEHEPVGSPTTTSSRKSKRSNAATTSTCDSPVKKSKSPMVRYMKQIATNFAQAVLVNQQTMKKAAAHKLEAKQEKEMFSVKRCLDLAFQCGIRQDNNEVYAMGKMFQDKFQREVFCNLPSAEARLNYFKGWCMDHGMDLSICV